MPQSLQGGLRHTQVADKLIQMCRLRTDMRLSIIISDTRAMVQDHVNLGRNPSDQTGSYYRLTNKGPLIYFTFTLIFTLAVLLSKHIEYRPENLLSSGKPYIARQVPYQFVISPYN